MLKVYPLPEWTPDLANNVLTEAVNVKPIANGYAPVKALQSVTSALAAPFNGGGAFIGSDGNSTLLASTTGDLLSVPVLNAPSTATTGGTLAAATYYYKITALNAAGETIASNEVSQVTTGTTSTVTLTWAAISGATGYRVYRGTAAGLENAYYAPGNVTTFTDTGAASTAGSPPASNSATTAKINKYTGSAWANIIALPASQVIRFAQFGDNILIATGASNVVKSYGLVTATVTTPTAAPNLIDIAQVRDFVMGITTDNAYQWCQFNNSGNWTTGANQADKQPITSSSGVRIIGGEYGIALKKQGIDRITYVGGSIVFQIDRISNEVGCMAGGSVANVGRMIFFLSESGFMLCDGAEVEPIGGEKFNRWFFGTYSRPDIAKIWAAIDPRNSCVLWGMPGTPGRILVYNWVLKRGAVIETDITGMFTGYTSGISLDALDATYGNLDAIPISLDDPSLQGGSPILLVADAANKLGAMTGSNLQATLTLKNVEPTPGKRSRIREARLVSDTNTATVTIDARMKAGDAEFTRTTAAMRSNGKLPVRSNGRLNTVRVTIPAGTVWSYIQGCELEFEAGDGR